MKPKLPSPEAPSALQSGSLHSEHHSPARGEERRLRGRAHRPVLGGRQGRLEHRLRCPFTPCPRPAPGAAPRPEVHPLPGPDHQTRIGGALRLVAEVEDSPEVAAPPWAHRGPLQARAPRGSPGSGGWPGPTHTAISSSPSNCRTRTCGPGTQAASPERQPRPAGGQTRSLPPGWLMQNHRCPLQACYCRAQSSMPRM